MKQELAIRLKLLFTVVKGIKSAQYLVFVNETDGGISG